MRLFPIAIILVLFLMPLGYAQGVTPIFDGSCVLTENDPSIQDTFITGQGPDEEVFRFVNWWNNNQVGEGDDRLAELTSAINNDADTYDFFLVITTSRGSESMHENCEEGGCGYPITWSSSSPARMQLGSPFDSANFPDVKSASRTAGKTGVAIILVDRETFQQVPRAFLVDDSTGAATSFACPVGKEFSGFPDALGGSAASHAIRVKLENLVGGDNPGGGGPPSDHDIESPIDGDASENACTSQGYDWDNELACCGDDGLDHGAIEGDYLAAYGLSYNCDASGVSEGGGSEVFTDEQWEELESNLNNYMYNCDYANGCENVLTIGELCEYYGELMIGPDQVLADEAEESWNELGCGDVICPCYSVQSGLPGGVVGFGLAGPPRSYCTADNFIEGCLNGAIPFGDIHSGEIPAREFVEDSTGVVAPDCELPDDGSGTFDNNPDHNIRGEQKFCNTRFVPGISFGWQDAISQQGNVVEILDIEYLAGLSGESGDEGREQIWLGPQACGVKEAQSGNNRHEYIYKPRSTTVGGIHEKGHWIQCGADRNGPNKESSGGINKVVGEFQQCPSGGSGTFVCVEKDIDEGKSYEWIDIASFEGETNGQLSCESLGSGYTWTGSQCCFGDKTYADEMTSGQAYEPGYGSNGVCISGTAFRNDNPVATGTNSYRVNFGTLLGCQNPGFDSSLVNEVGACATARSQFTPESESPEALCTYDGSWASFIPEQGSSGDDLVDVQLSHTPPGGNLLRNPNLIGGFT